MYTINFSNESQMDTNIIVFQQYPNQSPNMYPLAWKVKHSSPHSRSTINWDIDYSFVWGELGRLEPGIVFNTSQSMMANLRQSNEIFFEVENGIGGFRGQQAGPQGRLLINEGDNVPMNKYAVGIGVSGSAACVMQAMPGVPVQFLADPKYYIATGNYREGEILEMAAIQPLELRFSYNEPVDVILAANGILKLV